ncbi:MAG: exonuclease, partial [Desulfobacteraceae bacterium]|nr:exonuclease [Desulfobacteraceae bacterium]
MLQNSFIHIPGIGTVTEQKLWKQGIQSWADVSATLDCGFSPSKIRQLNQHIAESITEFNNRNLKFFESRLPANQL